MLGTRRASCFVTVGSLLHKTNPRSAPVLSYANSRNCLRLSANTSQREVADMVEGGNLSYQTRHGQDLQLSRSVDYSDCRFRLPLGFLPTPSRSVGSIEFNFHHLLILLDSTRMYTGARDRTSVILLSVLS